MSFVLKAALLSQAVLLSQAALVALALSSPARAEVTLRALMEDMSETALIEKQLPEFEKATGIKVEFEKMNYVEMHDKLVTQLSTGSNYYNLLSVDFLWTGEFPKAGWTMDLRPLVAKTAFDMSQFTPATMDVLGNKGQEIYDIPYYSYSMGLLYRKDILDDAGLKAKYKTQTGNDLAFPSTLEGLVALNKFIKQNAGLNGTAMQGQRGDPNTMEFSNYVFAAGGEFLGKNGKVTLDSEAGRRALTLYVDNINNAAQMGALTANYDDTVRLMCNGEAFSMITYWWVLPQVDVDTCPKAKGKVAMVPVPGGAGLSGAWGWSIPKSDSAEEQAAAWTFITWIQDKAQEKARALMGHAPVRLDVFKDPDVVAKYPYMPEAEKIVATGKSYPIFLYSAQYEDVLGTQVSLAASKEITPDAAIKAAAQGLSDLIAKAK